MFPIEGGSWFIKYWGREKTALNGSTIFLNYTLQCYARSIRSPPPSVLIDNINHQTALSL